MANKVVTNRIAKFQIIEQSTSDNYNIQMQKYFKSMC